MTGLLDVVILIISTISSFFISALAWLINAICEAAMLAFLPTVSDMSPENWGKMMGVSDRMNQFFPFLRPANKTFMVFALIIISVLFMFNLLKNFQPGIRREGLFSQIYRAVLAVILTAISYQIIGFGMSLGYAAIEKMTNMDFTIDAYDDRLGTIRNGEGEPISDWMVKNEDEAKERIALRDSFNELYSYKAFSDGSVNTKDITYVNIGTAYKIITREATIELVKNDAAGDSNFDDTAQLAVIVIVPLIMMIAIAWNAIKLFIEISERLVATTLITSLAPLGFCTVVTEETEGILKRYISMVFSTYLVFIIDIWFIRAFMYCSYTYLVQYLYDVHIGIAGYIPTDFIWFFVLQLAWLIVAQRADQYLRDAGLSVAQTGGRLLGELALAGRTLTGSMRTAGKLATNGYKHFNNANKRFDAWRASGKHHQGAMGGASHVMKQAMGKEAWDAMKNAGFVPTRATDYAEAVKKNGKATGELQGKFHSDKDHAINFRSCKSAEEAAANGHACYINPKSGQCFEVWSDSGEYGARSLLAPNNTAMSEFETNRFDNAERFAQNVLDTTGSEDEAADAYRRRLCGGNEKLMEESEAAAQSLLPEDMRERLIPVAAGFDSSDADDVSHLACIEKDSGRIVNFDVTTGDVEHDSLFNDRSITDEVNDISGFTYTDNAGKTVTAMIQSNVSEEEFSSAMLDNGDMNISDVRTLPDGSIMYRTRDENGNDINCRWFSAARHRQYGEGRTTLQYINGQPGRVERLTAGVVSRNTRRHSQKKLLRRLIDRTR